MSRKRDYEKEPCVDTGCRHDEVRNLYVQQLAVAWLEDSTAGATRASVDKQIGIIAQGGLAHGREVVFELFKVANGDGDITSPANTSPSVSFSQFDFLPGFILCVRSTPGHESYSQSHSLGICEGGALQINSQRNFF